MTKPDLPTPPSGESDKGRRVFRPGDLVVPVSGHPVLCEVIRVESGGLIRIRATGWPSGYSVLVGAEKYRLATGPLSP